MIITAHLLHLFLNNLGHNTFVSNETNKFMLLFSIMGVDIEDGNKPTDKAFDNNSSKLS